MIELATLPYHRQLIRYLQSRESDAWARFDDPSSRAGHQQVMELQLLRAGDSLDLRSFRGVYDEAARVAALLDVEAPFHLYRSPRPGPGCGVRLAPLPDAIHLLLEGPVVEQLYIDELGALIAREMTRFVFYTADDGAGLVAARLLDAVARQQGARRSHREAARLYERFTEVLADRGAQLATGDLERTRIAILKGVSEAGEHDAETVDEDEGGDGGTPPPAEDPEIGRRLRALEIWQAEGERGEAEIADLIRGEPNLASLDLLAQHELARWTRDVVTTFLAPPWTRSESLLAHTAELLEDLELPATDGDPPPPLLPLESEEILDYAGYLLLDLATADPALHDRALGRALRFADTLGITAHLATVAERELALDRAGLDRLRALEAPGDGGSAPEGEQP